MILFSDFDGTFYFKNDEVKTRANFEAIQKWRANGNKFCITTGRSYKSVTEKFPRIKEICDYYIVDSGSIILSQTNKILQAFYFEPEIVSKIIDFSKNIPEKSISFYYTPDSENIEYKTENVTKLRLWFKNVDLLEEVAKQIRDSFPAFAFTQNAISNYTELNGQNGFIEIIPKGYGKSNAIKVLSEKENIPSEDIITIGDGLNDYEMIRDFNGFVINGSTLSNIEESFKTTDSISSLINNLLGQEKWRL